MAEPVFLPKSNRKAAAFTIALIIEEIELVAPPLICFNSLDVICCTKVALGNHLKRLLRK